MLSFLVYIIILVICFYTILFALTEWKKKNYLGFAGIVFLVVIIIALPFYLIFLKG